jgi:hypothetical protein
MFKCTTVEYAPKCPSLITMSVLTQGFPLMQQQIYLTTKLTVTLRIQITPHHLTSLYSTYSFWGCILWSPFQREFGNCSTVPSNLHLTYKIWGVHSSDNLCCGLVDGEHFGQIYCLYPHDQNFPYMLVHYVTPQKRREYHRWCENFSVYTLMQECLSCVSVSVPGADSMSVLNVWCYKLWQ